MIVYLALAMAALLAAPPLWVLSRHRPHLRAAMDALSLTALAGLLLLSVLPHTLEEGGVAVLPLLLLGLLVPGWAEQRFHHLESRLHGAILLLAAGAMVLHAGADGLALSLASRGEVAFDHLAAGVVLHRLPTGLALWWLIRPAFGRSTAWGVLLTLSAITLAAGLWGRHWPLLDLPAIAFFEAAMVGMLLHVMVHPIQAHAHHALPTSLTDSWAARSGTLVGLAMVAALTVVHVPDHSPGADAAAIWLTAITAAPALLTALIAAVAIDWLDSRAGRATGVLPSIDRVAPWVLVCLVLLTVLPGQPWRSGGDLPAGPTIHWLALVLLLATLVASLLHQGIRAFLRRLMPGRPRPAGSADCGHRL